MRHDETPQTPSRSQERSQERSPERAADRAQTSAKANLQEAPRYIAVEGPIGAGKTTLTELLALRLGSRVVFERYESNPFLAEFYVDQQRMAFQTQIFFLLSRYRQQQELFQTDLFYKSVVSDYIFAKDRIFASLTLPENELKLYDQIEHALGKMVPTPDIVIYLQASLSTLEQNIRRRGRPYEKRIPRSYLANLIEAYNQFFYHYRETRLIVIDSASMDFLSNPEDMDRLLQAIHRSPHPPVEYLSSMGRPAGGAGPLFLDGE